VDSMKFSLCPACSACPEVEMRDGEVRIGEAGNLVVLKKEEWNVLVELIRSGRLATL
jgi:hypothetical protein